MTNQQYKLQIKLMAPYATTFPKRDDSTLNSHFSLSPLKMTVITKCTLWIQSPEHDGKQPTFLPPKRNASLKTQSSPR